MSTEWNFLWLFPSSILAYLCMLISFQQLDSSAPSRHHPRAGLSCPTREDITAEQNAVRQLIEERFSDLTSPCGGDGWRRVVFLNMCDPNETCPSNWTLNTAPVRGCGRSSSGRRSCDSVVYPVRGQAYSSVCGRILAYHKGAAPGFGAIWDHGQNTTEDAYVSGVSVTHGPPGARQHVWTFAGALNEVDLSYNGTYNCPCSNINVTWPYQLPAFIGSNYFCDTGNHGRWYNDSAFYQSDVLWNGSGCGSTSTCCEFNSPPWFSRSLTYFTREDLEIRICGYIERGGEDKIVSLMEVYVK